MPQSPAICMQSQPGQRIPDPYRVLGLADRRAGKEAIRGAFMTLAKTQHPDVGGDADQFMLISQSYELLSDPARRAAYDQAWMQVAPGTVQRCPVDRNPKSLVCRLGRGSKMHAL